MTLGASGVAAVLDELREDAEDNLRAFLFQLDLAHGEARISLRPILDRQDLLPPVLHRRSDADAAAFLDKLPVPRLGCKPADNAGMGCARQRE